MLTSRPECSGCPVAGVSWERGLGRGRSSTWLWFGRLVVPRRLRMRQIGLARMSVDVRLQLAPLPWLSHFAAHVPITFPFVRSPPPKNRPHPSTRFPPRELSFPTSGLARLLLSPSLIGFQSSQAPLPHFLSVHSLLLCVTPNRARPDLLAPRWRLQPPPWTTSQPLQLQKNFLPLRKKFRSSVPKYIGRKE